MKHGSKLIVLAIAGVMAISATACSTEKDASATISNQASSQATSNSANATSSAKASSSSSKATSSAKSSAYEVGKTATSKDISMTLVGVTENKGSNYNKPADGKVFLLCEFNIENNSTKELAISSMLSFQAYIDGYSTNLSITSLIEKGGKSQLDGSIAAGKKMNGVIGYEAPANWKQIEITLNPTVFTAFGSKTTFIANK